MFVRRTHWMIALLFAVSTVLVACGGGGGSQPTTDNAPAEPAADPATFGSLSVTVNYDGEVPDPRMVDASGNSECGVDTIKKQAIKVNDGKLKDAVVSVKSGPSGYEVSSPEPATVDQENCQYHPHVLTLKTGQTLKIHDSDAGLHNVRATKNGSQVFNETTMKDQTVEKTFDQPGAFSLVCDVHPWMSSYVYVTDQGKASVTNDAGSATLSDLPPGDYEITIWHEKLGTKTQSVTIGEKEDAQLNVTLTG